MPVRDLIETLLVIALALGGLWFIVRRVLPWLFGSGTRPDNSVPARSPADRARAENEGP